MEAKALCRLHAVTIAYVSGALDGGLVGIDDVPFLWSGCLRGFGSDLPDALYPWEREAGLSADDVCVVCSAHAGCSTGRCFKVGESAGEVIKALANSGVGRVRLVPSDIAIFDVVVP